MKQHFIKGAISNLAARLLGLLASFLNVYLLGRLLSADDFGLWVWLFSIFTLITSQDLGFISAMRVRIGRYFSEAQFKDINLVYGTALFLVAVIIAFLGVFLSFFDLLAGQRSEDVVYRNLAIICSAFTLLGTVSAQALLARLESAVVGAIEAVRALIQIGIYLAAYVFDFSIATLVYLFFLSALLYVPMVTKVYWQLASISLKDLVNQTKAHFTEIRLISKGLFREGALLWVGQIGMTMLINSDIYLAGYFMPDTDVAKVGVVSRFQLLGVGMLAATLLPVSASFVVRVGDVTKAVVVKQLSLAFLIFVFSGVAYIGTTSLWGADLILRWSTIEISDPTVFIVSGVLFALVLCLTLLQIFLQFAVFAKALVVWFFLVIVLKIALTAVFVPAVGYIGVFAASAVAVALFLIVSICWLFKFGGFEKIVAGKLANE